MKRKIGLFVALMLAVFLTVGVAHESYAALAAQGAIDPINGFPISYTDGSGFTLGLCLDPVNCVLLPDAGFNPALPVAFPTNWPSEVFYFVADALFNAMGPQVAGGPTARGRYRASVEAAFGGVTGLAVAGEQITFARINFQRIADVVGCSAANLAGCALAPLTTYTVAHPYGTFTFTTDAGGGAIGGLGNQAFRVVDGCAAPPFPCAFNALLPTFSSQIGPYLQAAIPPAPAGFIGNANAFQTVTGSPLGVNDVTITGPNIGGPGVNTLTVSQFNLGGQIAGVLPRFTDVPPTHPFFAQIDAVAAAGITGGCTPTTFCPDAPITRGQMAVFMEASLGVLAAPACVGNVFTDVSPLTVGAAQCGFIEGFAARGITGGCGVGKFCPNDPVTRAQMAVFVEAALGVAAPPACSAIQFGDVNTTTMSAGFCGFVEDFAAKGITGGCLAGPPPQFCPNTPVTRGQMAVFLVAAPVPLAP